MSGRGIHWGAALLALSACGPIPVDQAERQCVADAQRLRPVAGEAGAGFASGGRRSRARFDVTVSNRTGTDPSAAFDRCVYKKSGRMPTRPLYARTDWRG
jgi:hypothetical protein